MYGDTCVARPMLLFGKRGELLAEAEITDIIEEIRERMEGETHPNPPCEGGDVVIAEPQVLPYRANEAVENQLNVDSCRNEGSAVLCTTGARRDLGGSSDKEAVC